MLSDLYFIGRVDCGKVLMSQLSTLIGDMFTLLLGEKNSFIINVEAIVSFHSGENEVKS